MKRCQRCFDSRLAYLTVKVRDRVGIDEEDDPGYVCITYCLDCGQLQGDFPIQKLVTEPEEPPETIRDAREWLDTLDDLGWRFIGYCVLPDQEEREKYWDEEPPHEWYGISVSDFKTGAHRLPEIVQECMKTTKGWQEFAQLISSGAVPSSS